MRTKIKDLELGQIMYGNPVGEYVCKEEVAALLNYIFEELERVYWNIHQKEFQEHYGTGMKKLVVRSYYWGEDEEGKAKPNFSFNGVEFRWYKHRGRSMTINVEISKVKWVKWFKKCLAYIGSFEKSPY